MLVCREESSLEKDLSHAMSHDIRSPSSGSFGPFAPRTVMFFSRCFPHMVCARAARLTLVGCTVSVRVCVWARSRTSEERSK